MKITLRALPYSKGMILGPGQTLPCILGRSGAKAFKREGDGATPIGRWQPRRVLYRPDREHLPVTRLPVTAIHKLDGWCDAPDDRNYNRQVRLPYLASTEMMWRDDNVYDLLVVLGYNDFPRARNRGSAIFIHLVNSEKNPTAGCIALERRHMLRLLQWLKPASMVEIGR